MDESVDVWRRQVDDHMLTMAFGSAGSVGRRVVCGQLLDGHGQGDRVDVVAGGGIRAAAVVSRKGSGPEVDEVEDRAEIDVEALGAGAREDHRVVVDRVGDVRRVAARKRLRTGVVRRLEQVRAEQRAGRLVRRGAVALLDRVRVVHVLVGVVGGGHGSRVLQERAPVAHVAGELDAVDVVLERVAVGVDVELVADVLAEVREVRAARRLLERDPVGDEDEAGRVGRVAEEVDVRVVGDRIVGDAGRLAVTGRRGRGREHQGGQQRDEQESKRAAESGTFHRIPPCSSGYEAGGPGGLPR